MKTPDILIYTSKTTARIEYIFDLVIYQNLGLHFELTTDIQTFTKSELPKFSYGNKMTEEPNILAHPLLFENDIHPIDIEIIETKYFKAFFKTDEFSFFPFDVFAASFYLISRYEEYLPSKKDKLGRFDACESIAYKNGFLEEPIVNQWIEKFGEHLVALFPDIVLQQKRFKAISTIDVDNAWAHLNKGFIRTVSSFIKLLLVADFKRIADKFLVVLKKEKDPYQTFEYIDEVHHRFGLEPIYFILFAAYSKYDKNPSIKNKNFRKLIKSLSEKSKTGIHPSFGSNKDFSTLQNEIQELEKLVGTKLVCSRQHYLMLEMPRTYQNLEKTGITKDFSMGYASQVGFRAGYCSPFKFFNLKTNCNTSLEIVPFALMDVALKEYQKIEPQNALIKIKKIISSIKKVNGQFVSLWHNENLAETDNNNQWRNVFEQMLREISDGNKAHNPG